MSALVPLVVAAVLGCSRAGFPPDATDATGADTGTGSADAGGGGEDAGDAGFVPCGTETCNSQDDNCDGRIDEGLPTCVSTWSGSTMRASMRDGARDQATFGGPTTLAATADEQALIVADTRTRRVRQVVLSSGTVSTIAGSGRRGSEEGPALVATLVDPAAAVAAASGTIFVADAGAHRIRQLAPAGDLGIYAGSGACDHADGDAAVAAFCAPRGLALAMDGTLYVADEQNHVIRRVTGDTSPLVETVAGQPRQWGYVDGDRASALLNRPWGLALDPLDPNIIFFTDAGSHCVRAASIADGAVWTVSGVAGSYGNNDGSAISALHAFPTEISALPDGSLLVLDLWNEDLRRIDDPLRDPAGVNSGTVSTRYYGAQAPWGLAVAGGDVYISYGETARIERCPGPGFQQCEWFAGTGEVLVVDGGRDQASYGRPVDSVSLDDGSLLIADRWGCRIRHLAFDRELGPQVGLWAGDGYCRAFDPSGVLTSLAEPSGLARCPEIDGVFVAAMGARAIFFVTSWGEVQHVAGAIDSYGFQDGVGEEALFQGPRKMTYAPYDMQLVFLDAHAVRALDPYTKAVTTVAGSDQSGFADGAAGAAAFSGPSDVAARDDGTLYLADTGNCAIRVISPTGQVSTLIGAPPDPRCGGFYDRDVASAEIGFVSALALTADERRLIFADPFNHRIAQVNLDTGFVTALAGASVGGEVDGHATIEARFVHPTDVTLLESGELVILDEETARVRALGALP